MKHLILFFLFLLVLFRVGSGQTLTGTVKDAATGDLLQNATLSLIKSGRTTFTDKQGQFALILTADDSLKVSHIGFIDTTIAVKPNAKMGTMVLLHKEGNMLEEVQINTGYYTLDKERATGSYVHVDNKLFNRAMGGNVLQRMEGLLPGVQFVNPEGTSASDIRVRGISTIESDETPLIILDNFPYEGSIDNIDPNDVESITVLKDASAASIWGARAGNGVIVISSKKGGKNERMRLDFTVNKRLSQVPDLTYGTAWLPSSLVMDIEKERYDKGLFTFGNHIAVPLYVDYLNMLEEGLIDEAELEKRRNIMSVTDTRREAMTHLYRPGILDQYNLRMNGGSARSSYLFTTSYQSDRQDVVGNHSNRFNARLQNNFTVFPWLDLMVDAAFVNQNAERNGLEYNDLAILQGGTSMVSPYLQLRNEHGDLMSIPKDFRYAYTLYAANEGLLDWTYSPLEDRGKVINKSFSKELRTGIGLDFKLYKDLKLSMLYQGILGNSGGETLSDKDSYYVRSLVNSFTQSNGTRIIPHNSIFRTSSPQERLSHYGRIQANYSKKWTYTELTTLGGAEIRHAQTEMLPSSVLYNYDSEYWTGSAQYNFNQSYATRPTGTVFQRIPSASQLHRQYINRDLSYYFNGSYRVLDKYTLTSSLRWDGSNLFGVKANQKGVPLWSIGGMWDMNREKFMSKVDFVDSWKWRLTYGVAGNVNKTITHYPTISHGQSLINLAMASLNSIGNPSLRWEKVSTVNMGTDLSFLNGRIKTNLDYYVKNGRDLIGDTFLDPTTGVNGAYKINYADIRTKGMDLNISTRNIDRKFLWSTNVMVSYSSNRVMNFYDQGNLALYHYFYPAPPPRTGISRDVIYSIPWNGLNSDGLPVLEYNGEAVTDYNVYYNQQLTREDLKNAGVSVPTWYGSLMNTFRFEKLEVSFLLSWKAGYVVRRKSMEPDGEFYARYHSDYFDRWQQPGDELTTAVPRKIEVGEMPATNAAAISNIYGNSEVLVREGTHLRLQDVSFNYQLPLKWSQKIRSRDLAIYGYVRNLGLIWKKDAGLGNEDPDFINRMYTNPLSFSFGARIGF
ncbi:SusC/RagA family TonB-linked outer membrane protein [Sphingobacterium alkalisoli]|uniref:SusC/RagA family TonB-linked outer membrane protein n=1 Tax=Sphingobacterium alkalisoli TaxID=1874115 RepID=A0A4U0HC04_9SPHI|nr:SusC/RagA family TonB-linked outer membrane protein [Sphingobacterium alkalisoli]TJY68142.1 SusC/RagA family TonB-linked outer membrane protein [Sphingobacterium alkalisoli]GGH08755.1 SusC/RagA family TonB-linked outer membrane protein [Sphingobacterium alkalisoli]